MFERNAIDRGASSDRSSHPVTLRFCDGQSLTGLCFVAVTRTLAEELNSAGLFLDFEPYGGSRSFVAKAQISDVADVALPKANQLNTATRFQDEADPHAILGVQRGASKADVQRAYHEKAKCYHPDRFAAGNLPNEMIAYASDMSQRINQAYTMLQQFEQREAERLAQEAAVAAKPQSPYDLFRAQAAARDAQASG